MKKLIKNNLIGFIIGGLIFGSVVYAVGYKASDISYVKSDGVASNVNESLNDLYNIKNELESLKSIGNAKASEIAEGRTALVGGVEVTGTMKQGSGKPILLASRLSSGATVNCTSIPNYQNLTASNFMLVITEMKATSSNAYMDHTKTVGSPSYNASTGILTLPTMHWNRMEGDSNNVRLYVNVYVAY